MNTVLSKLNFQAKDMLKVAANVLTKVAKSAWTILVWWEKPYTGTKATW